ncbi:enoyl-CoA hydratase/carnithine racemase [Streptomyces turgidiscabies]|uniref:Enoyl-CoA hydratase/carnithine racemase n=1 Tax=Streptomyces turgidiscabies TaxID=85558 RepID=A0ABU0RXU8_9ACTN|nr:enoyl-CoA hydratase/carnithine racemase [Streptomyces turgidiscabies]
MEPQLTHSTADGIATVVIHHPAKRNAMTAGMWRALPPLLATLAADPDVHVLVLTGADGTFCAGADISTLQGSREEAQRLSVLAEDALAAFPKPVLAAIRGHCVGGGAQLAAACDLRFAEEGSLFGVTPAKLGLVYAASSTRAVGGPGGSGHRQVPIVLGRVDRHGTGAAHRVPRRGAAGR